MKAMNLVIGLLCGGLVAHAAGAELSKARTITLPTLDYREATIREILSDIAAKSKTADPQGAGVNVVINLDPTLAGRKLTMRLHKVTVEKAFTLLASVAGLYIRYEPNAVVVEKSERVVE